MEKIKIANRELLYLNSGVDSSRELSGARFNFALVKTQRRFEKDLKALQAAGEPSKEYIEYKKKLYELMKPLAVTDDKEQPVTVVSGGDVFLKIKPEHVETFKVAFEELTKKHAHDIKKYKEQVAIYNDQILREMVEVEIHTLTKADFPENITLGHIDGIMPLIEGIKHSEKDRGTVRFTNLAIIRYRQFFLPVLNIKKPEVIVGMVENLRQLQTLRNDLLADKKYTDYFDVYEKQRLKLCEDSARKDMYGNAAIIGNDYDIPDMATFNAELDKLRKKHKKIVDAYEELVNKEVELTVNMLPLEMLPQDITGEQMQIIADYIR
jgi:hypothetical protein